MTPPSTLGDSSLLNDSAGRYGTSEAAAELQEHFAEARRHFREPITNREPSLQERFSELARQWEEETGHLSSITQIVTHPAYQQIIGMGPAVVPLLLSDLVQTRSHWFWALGAITGENPVPREARGYVDRMVWAWIEWGRARGLL